MYKLIVSVPFYDLTLRKEVDKHFEDEINESTEQAAIEEAKEVLLLSVAPNLMKLRL